MHLSHDPSAPAGEETDFATFLKADIRAGTIVSARAQEGTRSPSYRLEIDFGPGVGIKASVAQITALYDAQDLVGRQIAAVVNFPPRQIGKAMSQVLTLGFGDEEGRVVLFAPDTRVPNGSRLF